MFKKKKLEILTLSKVKKLWKGIKIKLIKNLTTLSKINFSLKR